VNTPAPGRLDAAGFRAWFPGLRDSTYLASCSLAARHAGWDAAWAEMLDEVHRSGTPWSAYEQKVEAVRRRAAALLGTRAAHVGLVPNASIGAYQVASTQSFEDRPRIVSTADEFPSVSHVWLAQRSRGAQVVHVPQHLGDEDETLAHWSAAIDERTALVSVPLVSYRTGAVLPVRAIAARAHRVGARVFVDAYQGAGVLPVDAAELGCDYLVTGTCKYLLGLSGLAFLYAADCAGGLEPSLTGWMGRVSPLSFDPCRLDFPDEARRFETGTPAMPSVYAADASLRLLQACGAAEIRDHVLHLVRCADARLREAGERLALPQPQPGPMVALLDADPPALAHGLALRRVHVSPRANAVRISFHYYNNEGDVDALVEALRACRREAGRAAAVRGDPSQGVSRDARHPDRQLAGRVLPP
jgi:selenocysteine lyase/cysteine desulfurase